MMVSNLAKMNARQSGVVVEMDGGCKMNDQLRAMGLRPGVKVTKTSGQPLRGPVTLRLGSTEIAIGHGVASRILVEVAE